MSIKRKSQDISNKKCRINKKKIATISFSIFRALLMIGLAYVLLYPILYMLSTAFRPISDSLDPSVVWIPKHFTWDNIIDAYHAMNYPVVLKNTILTGVVSAILQLVSSAFTGYGFARFEFKGKKLLFGILLFSIIVPPQTLIIPLYLSFRFFNFFGILDIFNFFAGTDISINLLNSGMPFYLTSIFGTGIRSSLYICIFMQFFKGMPKELEDAANIDGCGAFKTFIKVMIPNAGSVLLIVFLFSIVWQWNDYYFSVMYNSNNLTISVALSQIRSLLTLNTSVADPYAVLTTIQAASLLTIAPLVILYIFMQKYFIQSIERTGMVE